MLRMLNRKKFNGQINQLNKFLRRSTAIGPLVQK